MAPQTNIGSSTPITTAARTSRRICGARSSTTPPRTSPSARASTAATPTGPTRWSARRPTSVPARRCSAEHHRRRRADPACAARQIDGTSHDAEGLDARTRPARRVDRVEMSFWKRILDTLIDPNIITLMLSLGIVGILVEMWNPGLIFPGTVGAIWLIVGLYGLQVLPVSVAGRADAAALARPLRDGRPRDLARRAHARRRSHVRVRRADALRPGRPRLPGLAAGPRSRSPGRSRCCSASRSRGSSRPAASPSRSASDCSSARRPRCAATGSLLVNGELWRAHRADGGRSSRASRSRSRRSETTSSWSSGSGNPTEGN